MIGLRSLAVFLMLAVLSACTLGREVLYQTSSIRDHRIFPAYPLPPSPAPFQFTEMVGDRLADVRVTFDQSRQVSLTEAVDGTPTVALLVIRRDTILYECYDKGYSADEIVNSFSMAKSWVSALVGIAVGEGKIGSVQDSMTHYLTEMRGQGLEKITLAHVLNMCTGLQSAESYFNPFAGVARLYYGRNLNGQIAKLRAKQGPGEKFDYVSANTQILGMIVERATGRKLQEYFYEKLWAPLGMESEASWSLDDRRHTTPKAFCCLNATARDFAKFGRLYLHGGEWNGQQVVPRDWVTASTHPDGSPGSAPYYQYQWWFPTQHGDFCAVGHLGQYIYVNPMKDLVIVRLGKRTSKNIAWTRAFVEIAAQL